MTTKFYYSQIINSKSSMELVNQLLNEATMDDDVKLKDYQYLVTVAKSLGFKFGSDYEFTL